MPDTIEQVHAREILSAVGRPTVEATVRTKRSFIGTASVPSGTSKGKYEAFELHDGGSRYRGRGARQAVENVKEILAPAIMGMDITRQHDIDQTLIELDGTENKSRLGGNAILSISVACAKAGALSSGQPCFRYLGKGEKPRLPVPIATVIAGGKHSPSRLDFEDYLYILSGFNAFNEALEALVETRMTLQELLEKKYGAIPDVGGALAPPIADTRQAFDYMLKASDHAGFSGRILLGLDVAANEFYLENQDAYRVAGDIIDPEELTERYVRLASEFPLVFIEDPFHEDDFKNTAALTSRLSDKMIVGDDLYASNPIRLSRGIESRSSNAILLKVNQIGTVTEATQAAHMAKNNRMSVTVSLRSSETDDNFIADFAVAVGAEQIKLGSPVRGERIIKYNRLLAIEEEGGGRFSFAGKRAC